MSSAHEIAQEFASHSSQPVVAFSRLALTRDKNALQAEVTNLLELNWVDHVNRQDYRGGWDVLPLRCQRQHLNSHPILQGFSIGEGHDWQDLPILASCPTIKSLLEELQCPVRAVRLMRLQAGAEIKPHRDQLLGLDYGEARLHMPVCSEPGVVFSVNHQVVPMDCGELWYINTDQIHGVVNNSRYDRINLVIDTLANDWLYREIHASSHKALVQ